MYGENLKLKEPLYVKMNVSDSPYGHKLSNYIYY